MWRTLNWKEHIQKGILLAPSINIGGPELDIMMELLCAHTFEHQKHST